jgi:glyoxylate/hydroxypyruvate reductase
MSNPPLRVLLAGRFDPSEREAWWRALTAAAPDCIWQRDDVPFDREAIDAAVVANPAAGLLASLPNLRFVQSLWAGVDKLLADPTLPAHLPIARMVDPAMNAAMAETALWAVLGLHRRFFDYAAQQRQVQWQQLPQRRADDVSVLVLGAGQMGSEVAARLAAQGYRVSTWRRRSAVRLLEVVTGQDIVINLLPLTDGTRGVLNAAVFDALPRGAAIVNLARGAHVVDADLLVALDSGHLLRAVLDVFHHEPLPADHPFWRHPRVTVLPHVAALTDERSAARVVAENLRALAQHAPLQHVVDRSAGY